MTDETIHAFLDLDTALQELIIEENKGNCPTPELYNFSHYHLLYKTKNELFKTVLNLLDYYSTIVDKGEASYRLIEIDVPKSGFTLRPMKRPFTEDWILYEAIVKVLSSAIIIQEDFCQRSFGFNIFKNPVRNNSKTWLQFKDKELELYSSGYRWAVQTDITGYFENISIRRLITILERRLPTKYTYFINILSNMLVSWSSRDFDFKSFGIPQGPNASRFLGEIYLDQIDKTMESFEGYYRFSDDIVIYTNTEIESKKALAFLIKSLRTLKLNINAKKTSILNDEQIRTRRLDPERETLNYIDHLFTEKNSTALISITDLLISLFTNSFLEMHFGDSHLKFAGYRILRLINSGLDIDTNSIKNTILQEFMGHPQHAELFTDLLLACDSDENIEILDYIKSGDIIYEAQEIILTKALLKSKTRYTNPDYTLFSRRYKDTNKHEYARAQYIILCGKFGGVRQRESVVEYLQSGAVHSEYLQMACIIAIQEISDRAVIYGRIRSATTSERIRNLIDHLKSRKSPLYFIPKPKQTIDIYWEQEY